MRTNNILVVFFFAFLCYAQAQEMPVKYSFGEKFNDKEQARGCFNQPWFCLFKYQ